MNIRHYTTLLLTILLVTVISCGGSSTVASPPAGDPPAVDGQLAAQTASWPGALPVDSAQPWEELNADGFVAPGSRHMSSINADSEFVAGVERYTDGGTVNDNGEATSLSSTAGALSWAMYRIPLGGDEPGVVSVDANLTAGKGYYVGLADYGKNAWQWHGPFSDNHVRFTTADTSGGADYISGQGSVFVCVVAHDGAACEVIGIGVNTTDESDTTAPPAPGAPSVTAIDGGLELEWLPVVAGDLAGYRVYSSDQWFFDGYGRGVTVEDSLEGLTRHVLTSLDARTYVRISAMDISGNESLLSDIVSAEPLAEISQQIQVSASAPSGALGETIDITATGAASYDFDTNGDGTYDVTGDTTGTAAVDTSSLGIIRVGVRGSSASGTSVALGGVSVIIAGNSRPVASASATPTSGDAPLDVNFIGEDSTDFDGAIVGGGWDFDGDGIYDVWSDNDTGFVTSADHTYNAPGVYNAKLRVVDNGGAWDVDTVSIVVGGTDPGNQVPQARFSVDRTCDWAPFTVSFDASGSSDSDGRIVLYEWDFDGNGSFDQYSTKSTTQHTYPIRGVYYPHLRVTDDGGATDTNDLIITLPTECAMFGLDPVHSHVSPYVGPQSDSLDWAYPTQGDVSGSPAVGVDGTIYFCSHDGKLFALSPSGVYKWEVSVGAENRSTPAIADDGTIYFGSDNHNFYAIYPSGLLRWSHQTGDFVRSSATIGPDGIIYVGSNDGKLYAFNPDGELRWSYTASGGIRCAPALAHDGTIYFGTMTGVFKLYALYPEGTLKWTFDAEYAIFSSPAIADDGTIYFGCYDNNFYALNPDGSQQWAYPVGESIFSSPAIGTDGIIYFGALDNYLYALKPDGSLKWRYETDGPIHSSPTIGADGVVYIGSYDYSLYAINSKGNLVWSYPTGDNIRSSPMITKDGHLLVGSYDNKLYSFER